MLVRNVRQGLAMLCAVLSLMVSAEPAECASGESSSNLGEIMDDPTRKIVLGVTTRDEIRQVMGEADENFFDEDHSEILVFRDIVNIPWFVSLIPVVGDIADTVELLHKNRELILQFDGLGVVKKVKVRNLD